MRRVVYVSGLRTEGDVRGCSPLLRKSDLKSAAGTERTRVIGLGKHSNNPGFVCRKSSVVTKPRSGKKVQAAETEPRPSKKVQGTAAASATSVLDKDLRLIRKRSKRRLKRKMKVNYHAMMAMMTNLGFGNETEQEARIPAETLSL